LKAESAAAGNDEIRWRLVEKALNHLQRNCRAKKEKQKTSRG